MFVLLVKRISKMTTNYLFIPKGGMCRGCVFKRMDCSNLKFDKMRVIEVSKELKLNVVRCTKYQKTGEECRSD